MSEIPEPPQNDSVLRYLMATALADHEPHFRALLENVAEVPDKPKTRDMTVATIGLLMTLGGLDWPVVLRVITYINRLSDDILAIGAVVIINGAQVMFPGTDTEFIVLDLSTQRETTREVPPAFVSTCYSMEAVWGEVIRILKDT